MKNKYLILISFLSCVSIACRNDDLSGHWHLEKQYILFQEDSLNSKSEALGYEQAAILDIENDTGFWNKNKYDFGGIPLYVNKFEKRIEISNAECFQKNFSYTLKSDTLILYDLDYKEAIFKGVRCQESCCNKQFDEFLSIELNIDLPIDKDTTWSNEYNIYRPYEQRVFIGQPKLDYSGCSTSPRLYVNNRYVSLNAIPFVIAQNEVRIPFSSRDQIQYCLYSDKNVELAYIVDVVQKFKKHGIPNFKLALREDINLEEDFKLRLGKLQLDEMSKFPREMELSEFLKINRESMK